MNDRDLNISDCRDQVSSSGCFPHPIGIPYLRYLDVFDCYVGAKMSGPVRRAPPSPCQEGGRRSKDSLAFWMSLCA